MQISKLRLINFRNIQKAELEFNSAFKFFVLYGANGAGKTSILEAISLMNSSKGMLKSNLRDMVNVNEKSFGIMAYLDDKEVKIEYSNGKKEYFIDGEKLRRLSQISKMGSICWLSPALDRLFYDSKKPRRDYFDRLVFALESDIVENLNSYSYMVQSRLKLLQSGSIDRIWLERLEKDISKLGVDILCSRIQYIRKLNEVLKDVNLEFVYSGGVEKEFKEELEELKLDKDFLVQRYEEILRDNRDKDIRTNSTSFGIHKSDIKGLRLDSDLGLEFSSMGQHKRALIDLIIGHVKVLKGNDILDICLLIDEITSHLDEDNKEYLFGNLEKLGVQTFLTGVKKEDFSIINNKSAFIEVDRGCVV